MGPVDSDGKYTWLHPPLQPLWMHEKPDPAARGGTEVPLLATQEALSLRQGSGLICTPGNHVSDLLHTVLTVQKSHTRTCSTALNILDHPQVPIRHSGDRW